MRAGHLKEAEEENFVQQAEKIVVSSKSRTAGSGPTTTDQPLEAKPDKTEPPLTTTTITTTSEVKSAGQLTPKLAPKGSHQSKSSSPSSSPALSTTEASQRGEVSLTGVQSRPQAKVVSEVTGEVVPVVANESTSIPMMSSSKPDSERERERPGRVAEVASAHRPLTRDVATGMTPATSSSMLVLGSQSSGEEGGGGGGGGGRKGESPPSLSTQTSNEVCINFKNPNQTKPNLQNL